MAYLLMWVVRLLVGAVARYVNTQPYQGQCIYFANHTSHVDTLALWSALPTDLRRQTRPVAAADYWGKTALRRHIALDGLNAVLIDRTRATPDADPLAPLKAALAAGDSLIIFPEGTRTAQPLPSEFKSGLFRLAEAFPGVALIPVYLDNLHRSMPKGSFVPVPLICTVRFGAPLAHVDGESKEDFLVRARQAVVDLAA
jgi:1-acyl-sn-glycerol-3-phosphate acyltransferase